MTNDRLSSANFLRLAPWVLAGMTLFLGLWLSVRVAHIDAGHRQDEVRNQAISELAAVRARLEAATNSVFSATSGIVYVVNYRGGISPDLFNALASQAIKANPHIRTIALAPDNRVAMIYPLAGNERVLGLQYSSVPEQYHSIEQAMRNRTPVLSGPVRLVQGGESFILRSPIFTGAGPGGSVLRYWGVASVVADIKDLAEAGGLSSAATLAIGLRQGDMDDGSQRMIWGDATVFSSQPVVMPVTIPGGAWQIAAVRKGGWPSETVTSSPILYVGLLNSILAAGLVLVLVRRHRRIEGENLELHQEIANRTRAEEELRLSHQKYLNIFNLTPDMVGITRLVDGKLIEVNKGFEELTGWTAAEAVGRTSIELGLWDKETRAKAVAIVRQNGRLENYQFVLGTKSGEKRDALMYLITIDMGGEECLYFMAHDITSLTQAQIFLENERLRFRNLVDSVDGIVWEADAEHMVFTYVSQQAERLLGYAPEEWYQPGFWPEHLHPEDRDWAPRYCTERTAQLRDHDLEFRMIARNGDVVWLHDIVAVVSEKGEPRWLRGVMVDTTGRKQEEDEKRMLEAQLRQSQKMEAIGRLAGGVAHDFNNKLSVILGYAEMASRAGSTSERYLDYLGQIIKAADQSRDITRQLLAFSRQEFISPRIIDLNDVIRDSQKGLYRFIGEDIRFELKLSPGLWTINMDPTQIDQIIMNLVVNARDAMENGGVLTMESENITIDQAWAAHHTELAAGEYVRITVSDTGCGMDQEIMQHIFEPFYTTKGAGKGTGLGLATIYGIVSQNKGFIHVRSVPGAGSTFEIYFPRCHEPATIPKQVEPELHPLHPATVLLVEDDMAVREITAETLREIGYDILVAPSPQQALELAADSQTHIDLLLTDVIMPDMNGRELSQRIAALRPEIKVLFMSGYTAEVIDRKGILAAGMHFLQKPFDRVTLHNTIRSILS